MKITSESSVTRYVYVAPCGMFYKQGGRGSFSTSQNGYSRKELLTPNISCASMFKAPMNGSPYMATSLDGGEWRKVSITHSLVAK